MHAKSTKVTGVCFPGGPPPRQAGGRRVAAYVGVVIAVTAMMAAGFDPYTATVAALAAAYVASEIAALTVLGAELFVSQIARQVMTAVAARNVMAATG